MPLSCASPLAARVLRRVGRADPGVGGERSRLLDFAAGRACVENARSSYFVLPNVFQKISYTRGESGIAVLYTCCYILDRTLVPSSISYAVYRYLNERNISTERLFKRSPGVKILKEFSFLFQSRIQQSKCAKYITRKAI